MNDSKLSTCHIGTSEPTVRLCQIDTTEKAYATMITAVGLDSTLANVIWGLLHDHADAVNTKTSARRLAGKLGLPMRSSARALEKLLNSGLLTLHGRSNVDVRYRLETESLLHLWSTVDVRDLPACFTDQKAINALSESLGVVMESRCCPWVILMCQLGYDYPLYAVLSALIRFAQDDSCVVSLSCLALADIVSLPSKTVHRKLLALEEQGLIERLDSSSRTACFRVCLEVLRALLAAPLPEVDVLPGITPLPALQRLFPVTPTTGGSQ